MDGCLFFHGSSTFAVSSFGFWVARFFRAFACRSGCLSRGNDIGAKRFVFTEFRKVGTRVFWRYPVARMEEFEEEVMKEKVAEVVVDGGEDLGESGCDSESSACCGSNEERSSSGDSSSTEWPTEKKEGSSCSVGGDAFKEKNTHFQKEKKEKVDEMFSGLLDNAVTHFCFLWFGA